MIHAEVDPAGAQPLWDEWRAAQSGPSRDALVAHYTELVRILAAKTYKQRFCEELEYADYVQFGMIGLLEAIDRYEVSLGYKFETFATHRIQGAILSGVETLSEKQQQIAMRHRLRSERVKSLAKAGNGAVTGSASPALQKLADVAVGLAIGFMLEGSGLYLEGEPASGNTPYEQVELAHLKRRMAHLVDRLSPQERKVIRSHYFQQVRFDQIAESMGLTKGRISQIHHAALGRLREMHAESERLSLTT